MHKIVLYIFSFFLGFGLYDPFGTNGLYFDFLTILSLIVIIYKSGLKTIILNLDLPTKLLFIIALCLFLSSIFYGLSYLESIPINFKFISAIIIFFFFSHEFSKSSEFTFKCLLLFALSCGLISLGYIGGVFNNQFEILNGRLRIFGENPNSISSRMAISFIILFYNFLFNPLNFKYTKFLNIVFFPSILLFIIDTGSRGSLLILVLAVITIVVLSDTKFSTKLLLGIGSLVGIVVVFFNLQDSAIITRFQSEGLTDSRDDLWANALQISSNNLILGVGEEGYKIELMKISDRILDTHNLILYFLVTGGIITTIIFLIFLILITKKAYIQLLNKNSLPMIILILFIFLMNKTGGIITYLVMWYFLAYINSYSVKN